MSEEEKRTKKQKIEDNRRLRATSQNLTVFSFTPLSSPSIVPDTEQYNDSIQCRKYFNNDCENNKDNDNKDNINLFDNNNNMLMAERTLNSKKFFTLNSCSARWASIFTVAPRDK